MMSTRLVRLGMVMATALAGAAAAGAQQPRVINARVETRAAAPSLDATFRGLLKSQTAPAWVAYAAPMNSADRTMCCGTWSNGYQRDSCCRLERENGFNITSGEDRKGATASGTVRLEGATQFFVLLRLESGEVGKIMAVSEDCELDAGGLPLIVLTGVRPGESISLLSSYALRADDENNTKLSKLGQHAVSAIAMHADLAADITLENFVAPNQPVGLRRHTAFWLGSERGRRGYEIVKRMVKEDPSDRVREHAIFALSISREPAAVDAMIDVARNDRSSHVRGQALFWLGQKAGQKAVAALNDAIDNDPETEIKKKAVFALSQLPKDEGVPLLIQVARTHKNAAVRKQAIFWLGQSRDPRALDFFEEILRN